MSEIGPYGVTQNADAASVTADQLVGDRIGVARENVSMPGAGPAMMSTAPYKPPAKRGRKGCYAKDGTCGSPALKGQRVCFFHSQDAK